jgi:predicted transcriptional regulator
MMTLTIDIPPELEQRLQQEAKQRGVEAEDYARMLLEELLLSNGERPLWKTAKKNEWLRKFNEWMDSHDPALPPLSEEATSRESIYGDRG